MQLFNSPVELGIRSVALLNAAFPDALDLNRLTVLDHYMLHSGAFSELPSVNVDRPNSVGELGQKRGLVEHGLHLMRGAGMVTMEFLPTGVVYRATEEADGFLRLMQAPLVKKLQVRAEWAVESYAALTDNQVHSLMLTPLASVGKGVFRWRNSLP
jgi:hypothetical protein